MSGIAESPPGNDQPPCSLEQGRVAGAAGRPVEVDLHIPPGQNLPLVLICHGFKGFKDWGFFPDLAARIARSGLACVRFNNSHNGTGLGADATEFTRLDLFERDRMSYRLLDLQAVMDALSNHSLPGSERLDSTQAAILGHSLGGAVALIAQRELSFRCLVTLAAIQNTGFSPEQISILERDGRILIPNARTGQMMPLGRDALLDWRRFEARFDLEACARDLRIPWLIAHGDGDGTVPVSAARAHLKHAPRGLARLQIIPSADHVMDVKHPFQGPSDSYISFSEACVSFLQEHLPGPPSN